MIAGIVRRAIALGRSFQNPLAFMASLCNPSKDIVALNLDSMQRFLTEDEIYRAIEQVMVTVTNQVGIDVNLAIEHEWLFAPLQFVSGLGPQRASLLKQLIRKLRWLPSRRKLLEYPYSFGKTIFANCAGFLRIRAGPNMKSADEGNPLDDTRVHPELYDLANDLADHAVAKYQASMPSEMEVDPSGIAIECIRNNSGILTEEVVLDFFNLQKGVKDIKMEILKDIQAELIYGFKDYRGAYAWPSEDDVFRWLTGKNEVGTTVNVTVCRVFQHRLVCVLGSGARGFIEKEDFTTEEIDDLRDLISEGSSLTCRISGFLNDKFALQLTYKENDLELQDVQTTGSSFEHVTVSEKAENKLQKGGLLNRRKISHKLFQNISREDALKVTFCNM
jgi:transcription elongation factor SPT6